MNVLVDTSVWADFLNGHPSVEADALAALLDSEHDLFTCGIIVAEVFQGLRRDRGRAELASLFSELAFIEPEGIGTYLRAAEIYRALRRRGRTVRSTIDCIIAATAEERGCDILARDRDMETILDSGLVRAARWESRKS